MYRYISMAHVVCFEPSPSILFFFFFFFFFLALGFFGFWFFWLLVWTWNFVPMSATITALLCLPSFVITPLLLAELSLATLSPTIV